MNKKLLGVGIALIIASFVVAFPSTALQVTSVKGTQGYLQTSQINKQAVDVGETITISGKVRVTRNVSAPHSALHGAIIDHYKTMSGKKGKRTVYFDIVKDCGICHDKYPNPLLPTTISFEKTITMTRNGSHTLELYLARKPPGADLLAKLNTFYVSVGGQINTPQIKELKIKTPHSIYSPGDVVKISVRASTIKKHVVSNWRGEISVKVHKKTLNQSKTQTLFSKVVEIAPGQTYTKTIRWRIPPYAQKGQYDIKAIAGSGAKSMENSATVQVTSDTNLGRLRAYYNQFSTILAIGLFIPGVAIAGYGWKEE